MVEAPSRRIRLPLRPTGWLLGLGLAAAMNLQGQSFRIQNHVIAAGGEVSSGGSFTVTGSVAQSAGHNASAGSQFSVTAGFWHAVTVIQTPGSPVLSLRRTDTGYELSWDATAEGFVLQETQSLSGQIAWSSVLDPPVLVDGKNTVSFSSASGARFYRLRKP